MLSVYVTHFALLKLPLRALIYASIIDLTIDLTAAPHSRRYAIPKFLN